MTTAPVVGWQRISANRSRGWGELWSNPEGCLKEVYAHTRAAGGVCVADEVQSGFGRTGCRFWGFETQGALPDIVTMAKGIGNGAALGAVVTTAEIASSFTQRIHFNTFDGNPVAYAQGIAGLEVIEVDGIQENVSRIGDGLFAGLARLKQKHSVIGEVRGKGLMIRVELVKDRGTKEPPVENVHRRMKDAGN